MAIKPKSTSRENLSQDMKVFVFSSSLYMVNGFTVINYSRAEQDFSIYKDDGMSSVLQDCIFCAYNINQYLLV